MHGRALDLPHRALATGRRGASWRGSVPRLGCGDATAVAAMRPPSPRMLTGAKKGSLLFLVVLQLLGSALGFAPGPRAQSPMARFHGAASPGQVVCAARARGLQSYGAHAAVATLRLHSCRSDGRRLPVGHQRLGRNVPWFLPGAHSVRLPAVPLAKKAASDDAASEVDSSGETCKGLSAADEGAPWDEGSHPDAQQLQSEWRERMFAHLAALEHPIPLQDLPRRCPRPPGLATRLGKVLANDPADRFTVIGRVSPPPHTHSHLPKAGGLGVRRAARVTPYRRPRLGQVAARYARQRRARASASRWPRRACARRRARGRRGLSTYKGARVGARRDAAGALELAGGAVRRPRVARVAWSREVPPPALLSTEGVYSRDMGRGNSREGGGVPPPAPIPRRRSNSSSRWRPGAPPPPPSPPPRTKWTRRVPHPVPTGHVSSLTPY